MDFNIFHPEELLLQAALDLDTDAITMRKLYSQWRSSNSCHDTDRPDRQGMILREQLEEEFSDFVEYAQEAVNNDASPVGATLLHAALADLDRKNFEPKVVSHIRSQKVSGPRHELRMGVISGKSPFWLPAISRLGKVSWVATPSPEGFDTPSDTRTCMPNDNAIASQLRDYPVDILFFEHSGPYPNHPAWKSSTLKMVVWLGDRRGFKPPSTLWS
jgi:hypothetical protein